MFHALGETGGKGAIAWFIIFIIALVDPRPALLLLRFVDQ